MPLFTRDRTAVLYVHVPKTGGSTIDSLFRSNGFEMALIDTTWRPSSRFIKSPPQHYHAELLAALLHLEKIDYVFMTVRHPLSRLVSEYGMIKRRQRQVPGFDDWVAETFAAYGRNPFIHDNHIRPQVDFRLPGADVFRQEDRYEEAFVARLSERSGLSLDVAKEDRLVAPPGERPSPSRATRAAVAAFYRADLEAFGYAADPPG